MPKTPNQPHNASIRILLKYVESLQPKPKFLSLNRNVLCLSGNVAIDK
jgi:hypothetical protein